MSLSYLMSAHLKRDLLQSYALCVKYKESGISENLSQKLQLGIFWKSTNHKIKVRYSV